jgi:hypothetical protein
LFKELIMPLLSILFGILLIALGLEGYTNSVGIFRVETIHSPTSLIPAGVGAILAVCGVMAIRPSLRKQMMHTTVLVGLIGAVAGLWMGIKSALGDSFGAAGKMQLTMGVICLVYVVLCVRSFIEARRRRKAAGL